MRDLLSAQGIVPIGLFIAFILVIILIYKYGSARVKVLILTACTEEIIRAEQLIGRGNGNAKKLTVINALKRIIPRYLHPFATTKLLDDIIESTLTCLQKVLQSENDKYSKKDKATY